jgi:hypothetical protein
LQANTVLLHWLENKNHAGRVSQDPVLNLRTAFRLGYNILMLDAGETKWQALMEKSQGSQRIDIWWWGESTSRLMLLLGYLLTRDSFWESAKLNVLGVQGAKGGNSRAEDLQNILESYRIQAESSWVEDADASAVVTHSADASLIFLPFGLRKSNIVDPFGGDLDWLLPRLPVTMLCLAAEDLDLDAEPEEGPAAEAAQALHDFQDAEDRQNKIEREKEKVAAEVQVLGQELEAARASGADKEDLLAKQKAYNEGEESLERARKKAAKARLKTEQAKEKAEDLGALPQDSEAEEGKE